MSTIALRLAARSDLHQHANHIRQAHVPAGRRFLTATRQALQRLSELPGLGSPVEFEEVEFAGLRFWPIVGFDNYLIFYLETKTGIDVIRILHSAQDLQSTLRRGRS